MHRWSALAAPWLALAGCGEALIPNTDVEDTEENREIIDFCEEYRIALEARDVGKLAAMTSDDYYEDGGSPPGSDDYDRIGLVEQVLQRRFARVEAVRYDIRYRRVVFFPDRVEIYYSFYGRFQVAGGADGESRWFSEVGDNRLVLTRTPNGYKILSGL